MPALAGAIWSPDDAPLSEATARDMLRQMIRAGDHVEIHQANVAYGLAYQPTPGVMLAIADHKRAAAIVRGNVEQTVWAMLDGRVGNIQSLRQRLEAAGMRISGGTPAEVLCQLYEREGVDAFARLEGEFALAIWDAEQRELTLIRDANGQRPMYYHRQAGQVTFASELRGLLPALAGKPELNPTALDEYFTYGFVPPPHTLVQGISKVPPGCWVRLRDGKLDSGRHDALDLQYELPGRGAMLSVPAEFLEDCGAGEADRPLLDHVNAALERAVAIEGPVARVVEDPKDVESLILSAALSRHDSEKSDGAACTSARSVSEFDWQSYFDACDEPLAHVEAASIFAIASAAERSATLLTPTGGRELFASRRRYGALLSLADRVPAWMTKLVAKRVSTLEEDAHAVLAKQRKYAGEICLFTEQDRANLYTADHLQSLPNADPEAYLRMAFDHVSGRDPRGQAGLVDWQTIVPNVCCAAADWAAHATKCQIRFPYLDRDISRFLAATPGQYRAQQREKLAPKFVGRVGNAGNYDFSDVPMATLNSILNDERFHHRSYLDDGFCQLMLDYVTGDRLDPRLHKHAFALAALEIWLRNTLDD